MKRTDELDGSRAIASLMVLAYQLGPRPCPTRLKFGQSWVDLFFVISGYLTTSIILSEGDRPPFLRVFDARRALRIWPMDYLTLDGLWVFEHRAVPDPVPPAYSPRYST